MESLHVLVMLFMIVILSYSLSKFGYMCDKFDT